MSNIVISVVDTFGVHVSGTIEGHTFVSVYAGRAQLADITAHRRALETFLASRGSRAPVLTVVGTGSTIGKRGRQAISRMLRDLDSGILAWAVVMEGSGFWLSAARVIASGVRLASGSTCPFKITSTVDEALAWLAEQTGGRYPATVTSAVRALEAEIRARTGTDPSSPSR
jgi:uncharacterized NAD-dependent epimerase/dehydratase family protein